MLTVAAARCAVLGSPVAHSLSPRLHRAAYKALGLDWRYDAYEVDAAGLPGFVLGLTPGWVGLSLTMPLKEVALGLADEVEPLAARVGAANTLLLGEHRRATNTDVAGLRTVLVTHALDTPRPVTVLGGGATARSALVALDGSAEHVVLVARDPARVGDLGPLALPYPVRIVALGDDSARRDALARPLVLNTTPPGALDALAAEVGAAAAGVAARSVRHAYVDVSYDPWPTPLAAAYSAVGRDIVSGVEMLVQQAALQVEAMTGLAAPLAAMWAAARPVEDGPLGRPAHLG